MPARNDPNFIHLPRRETIVRHAMRRMYQRHGVILAMPEYEAMVATIATGKARHVANTDRGAPVYAVKHKFVSTFAIWNAEHAAIATFYPTLVWIARSGGKILEGAA